MLRKKYLVIDVETAGGLDNPLVYDVGGAVVDKYGKIYETFSFVIEEIFYGQSELMKSAYYAAKIPDYKKEIFEGKRTVATFAQVHNFINRILKEYNINVFLAYNARFDRNALNNTLQFLTEGKRKYFLPYETDVQCIWTMAKDTICKQRTYKKFCLDNGFLTANNRLKTSAEVVYRYMTYSIDFEESHTGLEDVKIETAIFAYCVRQHKKMRVHYWDKMK
jgi:DNA polymerase III epsilon subunit-like protein